MGRGLGIRALGEGNGRARKAPARAAAHKKFGEAELESLRESAAKILRHELARRGVSLSFLEDATQELLLRLWRGKIPRAKGAHVQAVVRSALRSVASDFARAERRRRRRLVTVDFGPEVSPSGSLGTALLVACIDASVDPIALAAKREENRRLRGAFSRLPRSQQFIVTRAWVAREPLAVIADRYRLDVRTIQRILRDARQQLAIWIEQRSASAR